jgi:hypothetical protein
MHTTPLRFLTWGTITAAVSSAAWLASADQAAVFCSFGYRATSGAMGVEIPLPTEPTRAGPAAKHAGSGAIDPHLEAAPG